MDSPFVALNAVPFGVAPAVSGMAAFAVAMLVACVLRRARRGAGQSSQVPVLRRADAHPDAPPRAPLRATRDLGAPFLGDAAASAAQGRPIGKADPLPADFLDSVPGLVERPLPRDLSQRLATFDPAAIPQATIVRPATLPPLSADLRNAGSRAPARLRSEHDSDRIARPETDMTVHALLDRLERGVIGSGLAIGAAPAASDRSRSDYRLEHRLVALRNLARSA